MGFWLAVGKVALKVGLPTITTAARTRLSRKASKAQVEDYKLEDAEYHQARRRRERNERRDAEAAKR